MEEKQFRSGEMAKMTGLSRDTLRFYEKKGVIRAKRRENGYRYYSESDLYKLATICFHRKMNDALASIGEILSHSSLESQMEHIECRERRTIGIPVCFFTGGWIRIWRERWTKRAFP